MTTRIALRLSGAPELMEAVREHQDRIAAEVLANRIEVLAADAETEPGAETLDIDGLALVISLQAE